MSSNRVIDMTLWESEFRIRIQVIWLGPYPVSSRDDDLNDYLHTLLVRHEAEDGEDDHGGEERGEGVDAAHDNGIPRI